MDYELTLSEILTDPLIRLVLEAYRTSMNDFSSLLHEAAARMKLHPKALPGNSSDHVDAHSTWPKNLWIPGG